MKQNQFYCVKCRKKVTVPTNDICHVNLKSRKRKKIPALVGYCKKCECDLYKFVKVKQSSRLNKKYGRC